MYSNLVSSISELMREILKMISYSSLRSTIIWSKPRWAHFYYYGGLVVKQILEMSRQMGFHSIQPKMKKIIFKFCLKQQHIFLALPIIPETDPCPFFVLCLSVCHYYYGWHVMMKRKKRLLWGNIIFHFGKKTQWAEIRCMLNPLLCWIKNSESKNLRWNMRPVTFTTYVCS